MSPQLFLSTSLGGSATVSFFATGVAGATIASGQLETPFYAPKRNQYVELGDVVTGMVFWNCGSATNSDYPARIPSGLAGP